MAYYKDGTISIPNVTGDIVITATAVQSATINLLDEVGYTNGVRLSASAGNEQALAGACTTGFIPVTMGDVIRIKGFTFADYPSSAICVYDSSKSFIQGQAALQTPYSNTITGIGLIIVDENSIFAFTCNSATHSDAAFIKVNAMCSDGANAFATKNQPLPVQ